MSIVGLHHVQVAIPAGGAPAARGFYGGHLGMDEVPKPAEFAARGGVWFRSGTAELHLGMEDRSGPPARPTRRFSSPT